MAVTTVITLMLTLGVAERSRLLAQLRVSEDHARARAEMLARSPTRSPTALP